MDSDQVYSVEDVYAESVRYFDGDEMAATSWMNKYALRDLEGRLRERSPEQMFARLAAAFAAKDRELSGADPAGREELLSPYGRRRADLDEARVRELFGHYAPVIPQGSVAFSLGNPYQLGSLSNCVVLPSPWDSYGGVLHADQQSVQLHKRRAGVGIDLSTLRPDGSAIRNATGVTSGAVNFAHRFSASKREIAPNGRRGSLMLTMDVRHPDIRSFIESKRDGAALTGANVSVRVTDEFMTAALNKRPFTLSWPIEGTPVVEREVDAGELWETLVQSAWASAEPGILFWDRQHSYSTSSVYPQFRNVSTNPCGEIAMQGGDSCRLMTLNFASFVTDPFTERAAFDFERFWEDTYEAMRLADTLVDLEIDATQRVLDKIDGDPEPESVKAIERELWTMLQASARTGRRTGLGFTGLADTFAALGLAFGSPEALALLDRVMRTKCEAEFSASIDLAVLRGPFEGFDPEIDATSAFVAMLSKEFPELAARMREHGRRNVSLSTVPPCGTLSLLSGTSSGIEPIFRASYLRRRRVKHDDPYATVDFVDDLGDGWQNFEVFHPGVTRWMRQTGRSDPALSPYAGSTADQIDWRGRVEVQAIVQKYTTHSISSTVNLPAGTSKDQVDQILRHAWERGLKGITIYRESSRSGVYIDTTKKETEPAEQDGTAGDQEQCETCAA